MASKIRINLNIIKIADQVIEKKANDDTSLKDFSTFVDKAEKIKKVLKNGKSRK